MPPTILQSMKSLNYLTYTVVLILLAGCATTFRPWKLSEVEEGMSRNQVVEILGAPDSVETNGTAEYLLYSYSEDYNPPASSGSAGTTMLDADREIKDMQIKQSLKEYKYSVKMVDGVVQNYKELTD